MALLKIGEKVTSKIYPEYKVGKIINISNIGDENYCEVYFEEIKNVLDLSEDSLEKFTSIIEKMKNKDYDNPLLFNLRLFSEKIDSLAYQDRIISANNFNIIPLPHQILAVNHVLEEFEPRFLMADEVGLGKTIEAALIFEELKLRGMIKRALIISPSGLTTQWKDELKTKFNEDFVILNRETFKGLSQIHGDINIWKEEDQVITSIDFIKPKAIKDSLTEKIIKNREWHNKYVSGNLIDGNWDMIIVDEAHNLSKDLDGTETSRYKIGKDLALQTPSLLLLTATPHQGKRKRFRHLLELIDPYKFFDDESITPLNVKSVTVKNEKRAVTDLNGNLLFKDRIVNLIKISREEDNIESLLYTKVSEYVSNYHYIASNNPIIMFILITYQKMVSSSSRAIYDSLEKRYNLLENNAKTIEDLSKIEMDDIDFQEADFNVENVYGNILKYTGEETLESIDFERLKPQVIKEMNILEECIKLAKSASTGRQDVKIKKLFEIIDDVTSHEGLDTKFIIFTEFIKTQEYIGDILEDFDYKVVYFNGSMDLNDRITAKSKFKDDYQFLISTDAGGEGINLQFAHVMINYDLPWNPMKIEQRIGRIDRIGQEKDVLVFNFVIENTIEEHVRKILDNKLNIISDEFGDDKKRDVLSLLNEEYNFNKIFIGAVKERKIKEEKLQNIGNEMYSRAKNILENQQLLIPFTEENQENIDDYIIDDEKKLIENLITSYLKYENIELMEYSKNKNIYYMDKPIDGIKYRNIVFDKKISLENEKYSYINLSHPLVKTILNEIISNDSLSFNLKVSNYNENIKGSLFLYNLEITNNEGFIRKKLIPVFIDEENNYNEKVSEWFENNVNFEIKMDFKEDTKWSFESIKLKADEIKDQKIKEHLTNIKYEFYEKIEEEKKKFDKYFENKEKEINKRGIENIKESMINKLIEQKEKNELDMKKKMNLVPKIKLFAIAEITLE
ncbi:MAG: DEAD/DEAH box helicase [Methanobrevibacter sp.]|nr:DEAD/DEAH box helicase [Methanobrevibacter sp.]